MCLCYYFNFCHVILSIVYPGSHLKISRAVFRQFSGGHQAIRQLLGRHQHMLGSHQKVARQSSGTSQTILWDDCKMYSKVASSRLSPKLNSRLVYCSRLYNKWNCRYQTVWHTLRPSQQTTVSLNYSQSIKIIIRPSDSGTIIPLSHCIIIEDCRIWGTYYWLEQEILDSRFFDNLD